MGGRRRRQALCTTPGAGRRPRRQPPRARFPTTTTNARLTASPIASTPLQAASRRPYTKRNLPPPSNHRLRRESCERYRRPAPLWRDARLFRTLRTPCVWHLGATRVRNSGCGQNSFSALDDLLPRPQPPADWAPATLCQVSIRSFPAGFPSPSFILSFSIPCIAYSIGQKTKKRE
jgi:hypothetical protein